MKRTRESITLTACLLLTVLLLTACRCPRPVRVVGPLRVDGQDFYFTELDNGRWIINECVVPVEPDMGPWPGEGGE